MSTCTDVCSSDGSVEQKPSAKISDKSEDDSALLIQQPEKTLSPSEILSPAQLYVVGASSTTSSLSLEEEPKPQEPVLPSLVEIPSYSGSVKNPTECAQFCRREIVDFVSSRTNSAESAKSSSSLSKVKTPNSRPESRKSSSGSRLSSGDSSENCRSAEKLKPGHSSRPTSSRSLVPDMGKQKKPKSEMFVINFGPSAKTRASTGNLQDSFQRFQKMKIQQLKHEKKMRKAQRKRMRQERAKPENMWSLRMKFIAELKKYLGVPYAKRYFTPEDPEYESPIFLDCCGLVRRVLWNLQYLFGFRIGKLNNFKTCQLLYLDFSFHSMFATLHLISLETILVLHTI